MMSMAAHMEVIEAEAAVEAVVVPEAADEDREEVDPPPPLFPLEPLPPPPPSWSSARDSPGKEETQL